MGLGKKEKNFEKYLIKHFGLMLPEEVRLFYAQGIRVGNKEIISSSIHGELGYAACDAGFNPTNAFIQNFGHFAKKNVIKVRVSEAKDFAAGKDLNIDLGRSNKYIVVRYGSLTIGLGEYDSKKKRILNKIPEKRRRTIINEI